MIDFHTHLLHSVDDGSRSLEESLELLQMLTSQGVKQVFATPHFYADKDSPASFFERRERSFQQLCEALGTCDHIKVSLGAEIAYYEGFSRMSSLLDMRLFDTKLLLIEMPQEKWSDYTVRELVELSCSTDFTPVIAHVERYKDYQSKKTWNTLLDRGILMQANASYFINPKTQRRALKLLKKSDIHLISSDCHRIDSRPPRLKEAYDAVRAKLGEGFVTSMEGFLSEITGNN